MALSADSTSPETIEGINAVSAGVMRRNGTFADERIVMTSPAGLTGRTNCPVKRAPAATRSCRPARPH